MAEFELSPDDLRRIREQAEVRARDDEQRYLAQHPSAGNQPPADPTAPPSSAPPPAMPAGAPISPAPRKAAVPARRSYRLADGLWFVGGIGIFLVVAVAAGLGCERWVYPAISPEPLLNGKTWDQVQNTPVDEQTWTRDQWDDWTAPHRGWVKDRGRFCNYAGLGSGLVGVLIYYLAYSWVREGRSR